MKEEHGVDPEDVEPLDDDDWQSGAPRRRRGDELIIEALARGATQEEAAQYAGVSERTVRRRCIEPRFRERVRDVEREINRETRARITGLAAQAVDAVEDVLKFGPAAERLRAARLVLGKFDQYQEEAKLEAQIVRLYPDLF